MTASLTAALLLPLAGCSRGPELGPPLQGVEPLYSLLGVEGALEVLESPEGAPAEVRHLRPGRLPGNDYDARPCILAKAPAVLRLRVDEVPPGAVLEYSLAIRENGFRGREGRVRVEGRLAGALLFEHELDCSAGVPEEDRRWRSHLAELPGPGALEVRIGYEGTHPGGPFVGLAGLRVGLPFSAPRQRSSRARPNLLLVVVDTLRADRLHCYGNPRPTSPVLDGLAAEGLRFERAYSSAPWTVPGTASVLTGLSPPEHGTGGGESNHLSDRLESLPKVLAREGFSTAGFSCNPLVAARCNFDQGFEHFSVQPWYAATVIEEEVRQWIASVGERRFFLYLHPTDPHAPYYPGEEAQARLGLTAPAGLYEENLRDVLDRWYAGEDVDGGRLELTNTHQLDLYDAEIDVVDGFLGRVLDALEEHGLRDRTVVCFTADHGEEFLEHGLVGHFNQLFEESVHVPLVLSGPGVPRGQVVDFAVENRHVAPTLLQLAGVDVPTAMRGPDLTREEDRDVLRDEGVFLTTTKGRWADFGRREALDLGPFHSLIRDGWQLVHCPDGEPHGQGFDRLYDLRADPGCRDDRAAEHPERVAAMRAAIQRWLEEGSASRPTLLPTTEETRELLRSLGYLGDGD